MSDWQRSSGRVTSRELEPEPERAGAVVASRRIRSDWSEQAGLLGVTLVIGSLGLVVWAINGGYSVEGLPVLTSLFNEIGAAFYAALAGITFIVPVFGGEQPLIPWVFVLGTTVVQIVAVYRGLQHRPPGPVFWAVALSASLYDYITTFLGLNTEPWLQNAPVLAPGLIALILTFIVEVVISFLIWTLTGKQRYRRR